MKQHELALQRVDIVKQELHGELREPGQFRQEMVAVLERLGCRSGATDIVAHGHDHAQLAMGLFVRDGAVTTAGIEGLWLDGVACGLALAQVIAEARS